MFGTFGKSLHISLELGVACFLRRTWLFVLAEQTLEVLINGLSRAFARWANSSAVSSFISSTALISETTIASFR